MKTKSLIALILFTAISFLTITTASANSAPKIWQGTDASGAIAFDGRCPISVESELLTFDIPDFPKSYGSNDTYGAKVTARYSFYNPANYTVTARLEFPFGQAPDYSTGADDINKYDITVNGSAVEKTVRHTMRGYRRFSLEDDLPRIVDGYKYDSFYRPDLTVTKYTIEILDYDKLYKYAGIGFEFSYYDNSRIAMDYNSDTPITDGHRIGRAIGSAQFISFYVLGDPALPKYRFYRTGGCKDGEEISGEARLVSTEEMTFEELAFTDYPEDSDILRSDWYNAVVDLLNRYTKTIGTTDFDVSRSLMRWYEYEITLAPGERVVNTVTAPIYPDIDGDYDPEKFMYTYLLSPAKSWAEFGTLEIVINTPFYLIDGRKLEKSFKKTDSGYQLSLDGLPDGELWFTLSASRHPYNFWDSVSAALMYAPIFFFVLIIVTGMVIAAVMAVQKKK